MQRVLNLPSDPCWSIKDHSYCVVLESNRLRGEAAMPLGLHRENVCSSPIGAYTSFDTRLSDVSQTIEPMLWIPRDSFSSAKQRKVKHQRYIEDKVQSSVYIDSVTLADLSRTTVIVSFWRVIPCQHPGKRSCNDFKFSQPLHWDQGKKDRLASKTAQVTDFFTLTESWFCLF